MLKTQDEKITNQITSNRQEGVRTRIKRDELNREVANLMGQRNELVLETDFFVPSGPEI